MNSTEGVGVTIDHENFEECVQTMTSVKRKLKTMKEAQKRGFGIEILDHSDENVDEEAYSLEVEEEEDPRDKLLKVLSDMKGRSKMEVYT